MKKKEVMPKRAKAVPKSKEISETSSQVPARNDTKVLYIVLGVAMVLIIAVVASLIALTHQASQVIPRETQPIAKTLPPKPSALPQVAAETSAVVPPLRDTDVVFGQKDAPILLFEYADLECPFCKILQPTMQTLENVYAGKLAVVFRNYPLSIHPNAPMEANILACVTAQSHDTAKELINLNYERTKASGSSFTQDQYLDLAAEAGANRAQTADCYQKGTEKSHVDTDISEGHTLDIEATPTAFIVRQSDKSTVEIIGAYSLDDFEQSISYLLP